MIALKAELAVIQQAMQDIRLAVRLTRYREALAADLSPDDSVELT